MVFFSPATPVNDNQKQDSVTHQKGTGCAKSQVPSEPVLAVIRPAIQCLGPINASDEIMLSRMLRRLLEIEKSGGLVVAIDHAKELAELLQRQKCGRAKIKRRTEAKRH